MLVLAGCSQITAQPAGSIALDLQDSGDMPDTGSGSDIQTCEDITCQDNATCNETSLECICDDNFRECDDECISDDMCCTDEDCKETQTCSSGECSYKEIICDLNADFNTETGH